MGLNERQETNEANLPVYFQDDIIYSQIGIFKEKPLCPGSSVFIVCNKFGYRCKMNLLV